MWCVISFERGGRKSHNDTTTSTGNRRQWKRNEMKRQKISICTTLKATQGTAKNEVTFCGTDPDETRSWSDRTGVVEGFIHHDAEQRQRTGNAFGFLVGKLCALPESCVVVCRARRMLRFAIEEKSTHCSRWVRAGSDGTGLGRNQTEYTNRHHACKRAYRAILF